jgi:alkylated DNA repair dioxygenase AlkB
VAVPELNWQPSLLDIGEVPEIDETFASVSRVQLDPESWVDHAPGWVRSSDPLFEELAARLDWGQRSRKMYDNEVTEPRLTSLWRMSSGEPLQPQILKWMRVALSSRYEIEFDSAGFNLYRDGRDSVAWHGDRIKKRIAQPLVALVSLGEPRKFLLKPREGGALTTFMLGRGDLLVTGGRTQRTWLHSVPKVAKAGPRMSIAFRHGLDPTIYDNAEATPSER